MSIVFWSVLTNKIILQGKSYVWYASEVIQINIGYFKKYLIIEMDCNIHVGVGKSSINMAI